MKSVRVPGKVMLSGEYAVLYGGTAALIPVPRYLTVTELSNRDIEEYSPVIEAALNHQIEEIMEFEEEHGVPDVSIDSGEFYEKDSDGNVWKLGLGSSAAEAVGVVALRFERAGFRWSEYRKQIAMYADRIHREAQGGIGSGADVMLCAYRQPVRFRRDKRGMSIEPVERIDIGQIPLMHLVWTGQPADTRKMVKSFDAWLSEERERARKLISRLVESSHKIANAWFALSKDELFDCLDNFISALLVCTEAAGISYKLPIHDELERWAKKYGGRAKPTGAGGGDMILLIGDLPVEELRQIVIPL